MTSKYKTVSIPSSLHAAIDELIKDCPEMGYRTPTEFIIDAARRHFEKQLVVARYHIRGEPPEQEDLEE